MKYGQVYKIKLDEPESCKEGQMVFPDNESNVCAGFILKVEESFATICLFQPNSLPETAQIIFEDIEELRWKSWINEIFERNPDIAKLWYESSEEIN